MDESLAANEEEEDFARPGCKCCGIQCGTDREESEGAGGMGRMEQ